MTTPTTARERLTAKIAGQATALLIDSHRQVIPMFWAAVDAKTGDADAYQITIDAIADELLRREVPMSLCCFCPVEAGYHDDRICDLKSE